MSELIHAPKRWPLIALVPVVAAFAWGGALDAMPWFLAIVPGVFAAILGGTGLAHFLFPGDIRITQMMALSSILVMVLGLLCGVWFAPFWVILALALSAAAFLAAGRIAWTIEPVIAEAPAPQASTALDFWVAVDEALMGYFSLLVRVPEDQNLTRLMAEVEQADEVLAEYKDSPADFHQTPQDIPTVESRSKQHGKHPYQHLSCASEFEPHPNLPGIERWQGYSRNQTAHARMFEHEGEPRPWLVCIHGYRMGDGLADFSVFSPGWLHHKLGFNVIMPVLPLHGPRRRGKISGAGYLDGDVIDLLHAETQAIWDIRRWILWLREEKQAENIGAYGISLGGYNTALLASLEKLQVAIAGEPAIDLPSLLWRHFPDLQERYWAQNGLDLARMQSLLNVVNPLAMTPQTPEEHCAVFAGTADRLVMPANAQRIIAHWEQGPSIWYQGSHLSFGFEDSVQQFIETTFRDAGLVHGQ